MARPETSWLKLSIDVRPSVNQRRGERLRWEGTLVLTGSVSGHAIEVPLADCRAQVALRPPPAAREVLLRLVASALRDGGPPMPRGVQDAMIAAVRRHLEGFPAAIRNVAPKRPAHARPRRSARQPGRSRIQVPQRRRRVSSVQSGGSRR